MLNAASQQRFLKAWKLTSDQKNASCTRRAVLLCRFKRHSSIATNRRPSTVERAFVNASSIILRYTSESRYPLEIFLSNQVHARTFLVTATRPPVLSLISVLGKDGSYGVVAQCSLSFSPLITYLPGKGPRPFPTILRVRRSSLL